jgi:protein-L-isoaspartate(D-aspartate) O-methyltransferase
MLASLPPWLLFQGAAARAADAFEPARRGMVANVRQLIAAGAAGEVRRLDPRVLRALETTPRHLFVPERIEGRAYEDSPQPIGHGATISQPLVVAVMTELARPQPDDVVLEVGTGSGYQAAILSGLVRQVYSIELVEPLARAAADRLARLGYKNVSVRAGDGYQGWPEHAPFDSILVTAGAPSLPPALVRQLKPGGRIVIPIGPDDDQHLTVVEKDADGRVRQRRVMQVVFVPLRPGARP